MPITDAEYDQMKQRISRLEANERTLTQALHLVLSLAEQHSVKLGDPVELGAAKAVIAVLRNNPATRR